jgi:hypothetical protein
LTYIKVKPGKFEDYMKYLSTTCKSIMEAENEGLIGGYGVYSAEPRTPQEPDLILTTVAGGARFARRPTARLRGPR